MLQSEQTSRRQQQSSLLPLPLPGPLAMTDIWQEVKEKGNKRCGEGMMHPALLKWDRWDADGSNYSFSLQVTLTLVEKIRLRKIKYQITRDGPQVLYGSLERTEKFMWVKRSGKKVCTELGFKGLHG